MKLTWKGRKVILSVFFLLSFFIMLDSTVCSQNDTVIPYKFYSKKIVIYSDFGFNSAPFSMNYQFPNGVDKIKYRNNYKNLFGIGCSYKWFSLRLSFAIGQNARPIDKYGKTNYGTLGFNFTHKNTYWDFEFRNVAGYSIKNAYKWNDSLSEGHPNDIRSKTNSFAFSVNAWYFKNPYFKMQAVLGKTGHFLGEVKTWYFKNTLNLYGVANGYNSLIPSEMTDNNNSKTSSTGYGALDFGVIPGYAYANRKNNWQVSGLLGLGPVIQVKSYNVNGVARTFLGLAPRYDVRFVAGYSKPSYFIFLVTDIDNKSIRFNNLVFRQSFYSLNLVAGIRLNSKKDRKEKDLIKE